MNQSEKGRCSNEEENVIFERKIIFEFTLGQSHLVEAKVATVLAIIDKKNKIQFWPLYFKKDFKI